MELTLKCKVIKKVSKNNLDYYVLYVEEIDKYFFLSYAEARLLILSNGSTVETIE